MLAESTVFVVDDDETALASMRWLLESDGLAAETFSSAKEFLLSDGPDRPGCLVLDLRMPGMDGLMLQEKLSERGTHLPIIFVSGCGNVSQCAKAMKNGAVDFLEKPVDDGKMVRLVRQALEEDRQRRLADARAAEIAARIARLTPREHEVMHLLHEGDAIKTIAARFHISFQTAAKHRSRVLAKLDVNNEAALVRLLANYPLHE